MLCVVCCVVCCMLCEVCCVVDCTLCCVSLCVVLSVVRVGACGALCVVLCGVLCGVWCVVYPMTRVRVIYLMLCVMTTKRTVGISPLRTCLCYMSLVVRLAAPVLCWLLSVVMKQLS